MQKLERGGAPLNTDTLKTGQTPRGPEGLNTLANENRQFLLREIGKLPNAKQFRFTPDPSNERGLMVIGNVNGKEILFSISHGAVGVLEEFPTIEIHDVRANKKFSDFCDSSEEFNKYLGQLVALHSHSKSRVEEAVDWLKRQIF